VTSNPDAPYYTDATVTLYAGDCLDVLRELPDNSVDSVVTDPPYGLEFMGKDWDAFRQQRDPRTAGRSGAGAVTGDAGIGSDTSTPGGRSRASFGGKRPTTWRCDSCGKRDQFRNHAAAFPDCQGQWWQEVIDPTAPSPLLPFQQWCESWATECLRVLKPGGHLLAFGGTRTYHRLTCAVEDAGFEIRDGIAWLYGSGFPKSLDVSKAIDKKLCVEAGTHTNDPDHTCGRDASIPRTRPDGTTRNYDTWGDKTSTAAYGDYPAFATTTAPATDAARQWQGWGTALKPAFEPIVVARKPLAGTVAANVQAWGTGALNVDGCRIESGPPPAVTGRGWDGSPGYRGRSNDVEARAWVQPSGRWPANVVLDEHQAAALDQMSGETVGKVGMTQHGSGTNKVYGTFERSDQSTVNDGVIDRGGASRFFYTAKADAKERIRLPGASDRFDAGRSKRCVNCGKQAVNVGTSACVCPEPDFQPEKPSGYVSHPTVKPLSLMRWLVRLVTPPGGTVLEPFAGSGTTVEACILEGFSCIAIEREADYLPLIVQRVNRQRDPIAYTTAAGEDLGLFGDLA
jgi:site-specific DNA-methyltransferase (adenine-specific)